MSPEEEIARLEAALKAGESKVVTEIKVHIAVIGAVVCFIVGIIVGRLV